ncbi:MAG: DUF4363 family protein [Candidatus Merdivicinus sp.]|jgi:hypothetical protein
MKRLIVICCMIGAILAAGTWSLLWLGEYTDRVAERLETVAELALSDEEAALDELKSIQDDWHQKEHWIGVFVHEDPLEEMSDRLEECVALLRRGMNEDFQVRIRQAIFSVRNIYHQEIPNIENIL